MTYPKQKAALLTSVKPVKPVIPAKPVAPVAQVKPVRAVLPPAPPTGPMPGPSPMARPPVAPTSRQVPSVPTPRGVVRTDTHNAANNHAPASGKHGKRGFKGG